MGSTKIMKISVADVGCLKATDLLVDEANFRLEPGHDQPFAIKAMVRRQGRVLVASAKKIPDNGEYSSGQFIWLAAEPRPDMSEKFVVCDPNCEVA